MATNVQQRNDMANMRMPDLRSHPGRSYFQQSRWNLRTIDIGPLIPVFTLRMAPGETVELGNRVTLIGTNPLVSRPIQGMDVFVHYYFMRDWQMWKGAKVFHSRGIDGNITLTMPRVRMCSRLQSTNGVTVSVSPAVSPHSLADYFGFPVSGVLKPTSDEPLNLFRPVVYSSSISLDNYVGTRNYDLNDIEASALPFFMYQSVYKWYYANWNLMRNNKNWLPDDEDDWVLDYGSTTRAYAYASPDISDSDTFGSYLPLDNLNNLRNDCPALAILRYRQWRPDRFTTALPWLSRGNMPLAGALMSKGTAYQSGQVLGVDFNVFDFDVVKQSQHLFDSNDDTKAVLKFSSGVLQDAESFAWTGNAYAAFNMNVLRYLAVMTSWSEQLAQCDGSYNDFIQSFYGVDAHSNTYKPLYIGGSKQAVYFSEVVQTSADSTTPLGTQAGRAYSTGDSYIGRFTSDDFGYLMAILSIVPSTVYADSYPSDMRGNYTFDLDINPKFAALPPQPITIDELYVNSGHDDGLFAYEDRYGQYKTPKNQVGGMLSIPPGSGAGENYYTGLSWARYFATEPSFNSQFVSMSWDSIRRDMWSQPTQPPFTMFFEQRCDMWRQLPQRQVNLNFAGIA